MSLTKSTTYQMIVTFFLIFFNWTILIVLCVLLAAMFIAIVTVLFNLTIFLFNQVT